ncbi:MAG: AI-2E family transporter [Bacteroidota bacterium]
MRLQANRPLLKVSFVVFLIVIVFAIATLFPKLTWALIISGLIAFLLKPLVKYLEIRIGLSRVVAILGLFFFFAGWAFFLLTYFAPWLSSRVVHLFERFEGIPVNQELQSVAIDIAKILPFIKPAGLAQEATTVFNDTLLSLRTGIETLPSAVFALIPIAFMTYFILAGGDVVLKKLIERVPNKYFEMTLNVLYKIQKDLVGYLRGWILDSVIVAILFVVGYMIIGVDYPVLMGAIAGIANLVPYVGPVAGAIPAFAISLTQHGDFRMLVPITVLTIIIQTLDNIIIQPLSFAQTVDMHPLTVVVLLFAGNELMGVSGMLLAIPIATILKVSAKESYWGLKNYRITAS